MTDRTERLEVAGCWLVADVVAGHGGPVVFLHGASSSRAEARRILSGAGIDRPFLLPDSRGHGDSVDGVVTNQSWQQLIDDAVAWLDHLDVRDAVVAGVSMGALIAPAVALARPDRVSSLVPIYPVYLANDAPPDPDHDAALSFLLQSFSEPDADVIISALTAAVPDLDPTPVRERLGLHRDLAGVSAYFRDDRSAAALPYSTADVSSLRIPVTVVGGADAFHPAEVARQLAALIPDAYLVDLVDVPPEEHEGAMGQAVSEHIARLR